MCHREVLRENENDSSSMTKDVLSAGRSEQPLPANLSIHLLSVSNIIGSFDHCNTWQGFQMKIGDSFCAHH